MDYEELLSDLCIASQKSSLMLLSSVWGHWFLLAAFGEKSYRLCDLECLPCVASCPLLGRS